MNAIKWIVTGLVLGAAGMGSAWADHHGNVHFGVMVGPGWGPWYYPPGYYYPPVVIERPVPPPVYIEQPSAPLPTPTNYWYYCAAGKGYYPYVKECPGGWQKVAPQPPGQP